MELRVLALYPEQMNIYADRGNIIFLRRRCEWRGIGFSYAASGPGEEFDPAAHDLLYLGGGQDRDQRAVAADMVATKRDSLASAVGDGAVMLAVCGGYQLLGHSYQLGEERLPGLGLADLETVREPGERLIGNVAIEADLGDGPRTIAGFENHGGRTYLGAGRDAAGARPARLRQQRQGRLRGRAPGQPDRHLPARPAAAEERLAGRPPDRPGAGAPLRRTPYSGAIGRFARAGGARLRSRSRVAQMTRGRAFARYAAQTSAAVCVLVLALATGSATAAAAPSCEEGPQQVGETIYGTPCADTIQVPRGVTAVYGEAGDDTLYGGRGNQSLYGGPGNDRLYGGIGDDHLRGGPGDDLLSGGFGADSLDGEEGNDYERGDATIDYLGDTRPGQRSTR